MDNIFDDDNKNKTDDDTPKYKINEDGSVEVGGKKYKDVEAVIEGKLHADSHIDKIIKEKRELEASFKEIQNQKSMLEALNNKIDSFSKSSSRINDDYDDDDEDENYLKGFDKPKQRKSRSRDSGGDVSDNNSIKKIEDLENQLNQMKKEQSLKEAAEKFKDTLIDAYDGDKTKAKEAWNQYKDSEDYDEEDFNNRVVKNPKGLVKYITKTADIQVDTKSNTLPRAGGGVPGVGSSQRPASSSQSGKNKRDFSYWYKKMKNNPGSWTMNDQLEMNRAFEESGEDFFSSSKDRILKHE